MSIDITHEMHIMVMHSPNGRPWTQQPSRGLLILQLFLTQPRAMRWHNYRPVVELLAPLDRGRIHSPLDRGRIQQISFSRVTNFGNLPYLTGTVIVIIFLLAINQKVQVCFKSKRLAPHRLGEVQIYLHNNYQPPNHTHPSYLACHHTALGASISRF